jgi:ketosteroid isomerase-like protein
MRAIATLGVAVLTTWVSSLMAADRSAELERVVASERAFAARAQQVNPRQAFAEFFAPGAVLYTPYPVPAFPRLREAPDWGVNIQWRPVAAAISGAGDMGYTTGPSEYRRTSAEPPVGFGHYTSVWQRQPDGRYLVRIDIGIEHPAPPTTIEDWTAPARAPMAAPVLDRVTLSAALAGLREVDARIGAQDSANATVSLAAALAEDARLHRGGRLPVTGRAQVLADLSAHHESLAWTPEAAVVAESGDFGFVYGRGQWKRLQPEETGELVYLNIWQRRGGDWRLIVHVSNPVPVAAPTPAR